jgi:hypothetical protein
MLLDDAVLNADSLIMDGLAAGNLPVRNVQDPTFSQISRSIQKRTRAETSPRRGFSQYRGLIKSQPPRSGERSYDGYRHVRVTITGNEADGEPDGSR